MQTEDVLPTDQSAPGAAFDGLFNAAVMVEMDSAAVLTTARGHPGAGGLPGGGTRHGGSSRGAGARRQRLVQRLQMRVMGTRGTLVAAASDGVEMGRQEALPGAGTETERVCRSSERWTG